MFLEPLLKALNIRSHQVCILIKKINLDSPIDNKFKNVKIGARILELQKGTKRPHCNSDFINKIEVKA